MINQAEIAKAKIVNSSQHDDDSKKNLLNILAITTQATNGISPEEKIQKMTEAVLLLTISQIQTSTSLPAQIESNITRKMQEYTDKRCQTCRAMLHVDKCEKEESIKHGVDLMKEKSGTQKKDPSCNQPWSEIVKSLLMRPYPWIFASILAFSPYGVDLIKTIAQIFGK